MKLSNLLLPVCFFGLLVPSISSAKPVCPSQNFSRFLNVFERNVKVQKAFTKIPLKFGSYAPNYGNEPAISYLTIDEIDYPVLIDAKTRKKQGVVLTIDKKGTKWYQVNTHSMGTGAYTIEYNFKRYAGCWRLVSMIDSST